MAIDSFGRRGSALVLVEDARISRATVLVLQEMDFSVDVANDAGLAERWAGAARYEVIVCGGDPNTSPVVAARLRRASLRTRIVVLARPGLPVRALNMLGVEIIRPPIDVNSLVDRFMPAAA